MSGLIDLKGKRFGRVTVLEKAPHPQYMDHASALWKCRCDCGTEFITSGRSLRMGTTRSCGCLRDELSAERRYVHGMSRTPLCQKWYRMVAKSKRLGLPICDMWKSFKSFAAWAYEHGYEEGMKLVRTDNSLGFSPKNCKLVCCKEAGHV